MTRLHRPAAANLTYEVPSLAQINPKAASGLWASRQRVASGIWELCARTPNPAPPPRPTKTRQVAACEVRSAEEAVG